MFLNDREGFMISYQKGNDNDRKNAALILIAASQDQFDEGAHSLLKVLAPMIRDNSERNMIKLLAVDLIIQSGKTFTESEIQILLDAFEATWAYGYNQAISPN